MVQGLGAEVADEVHGAGSRAAEWNLAHNFNRLRGAVGVISRRQQAQVTLD